MQSNKLYGNQSRVQGTRQSRQWWLQFIREPRWTRSQKHHLLRLIGDPAQIYQSAESDIAQCLRQHKSSTRRKNKQAPLDQAALVADQQWLANADNHLVTILDPNYPALLREIHDPPLALFVTGNTQCLQSPAIAMVGSRRPTPVGSHFAKDLARELATAGLVVVSGMALGIDGEAHRGAISTVGQTIAVLAGGIDRIYPARHRQLYQQIVGAGCVVSEYPPGVAVHKHSFPQRNRIVSGLSSGVIIVEAAERSGTLITARFATEQNREVMVVPGSVLSAQYRGSHQLIQQGAALVRDAQDVFDILPQTTLEALSFAPPESLTEANSVAASAAQSYAEHPLLTHLSDQPCSVDQIILASGLTASEVSSMLLLLEVDGVIAAADNGGYVRLS